MTIGLLQAAKTYHFHIKHKSSITSGFPEWGQGGGQRAEQNRNDRKDYSVLQQLMITLLTKKKVETSYNPCQYTPGPPKMPWFLSSSIWASYKFIPEGRKKSVKSSL